MTHRIALGGAALGTLGLMASGWCSISSGAAQAGAHSAARALPVTTQRVALVPGYALRRSYTGVLRARREVELGFEVAGRIDAFLVREGQTVQAGEPIARLEIERLEARRGELVAARRAEEALLDRMEVGPRRETIDASRAMVRELEEQHRLAVTQRERRRPLVESGAVAGDQFDEMDAGASALDARLGAARSRLEELVSGTRVEDLAAQRAQLETLDARLQAIDVELADSTLRAPFTGRVAARHLDEGAVVSMGQPALRLVESERLEAWIGLPVALLAELEEPTQIELEVGGRRIPAQGRRALPELDESTRTATLIVELAPEDSSSLRAGEVARLFVEREVAVDGTWLPTSALKESTRGLWSAFVVESVADGVVRARSARLEVLHVEGERVFVRGTLRTGDQVISAGVHRLVAGQLVQPQPETTTAAAIVSID